MKNSVSILVHVALLAGTVDVAYAQDRPLPTSGEAIAIYDRNENGELEREELILFAQRTGQPTPADFASETLGVLCATPTARPCPYEISSGT